MRDLLALSLLLLAGPALAEPATAPDPAPAAAAGPRVVASAPAAASEPAVRLDLDQKEVQELKVALDAAVRASGYSPVSVNALAIGAKLERAATDAAKAKDSEKH